MSIPPEMTGRTPILELPYVESREDFILAKSPEYGQALAEELETKVNATYRSGIVNVLGHGVVGDSNGTAGNGTDDTAALVAAAAAALSAGKTLFIPEGMNVRITAAVDLVGVDVECRGTITVDYLGGPGVTAGGDSSLTTPRPLYFRRVHHAAGTGQSVPALRLVGLKNAKVIVQDCHYLQLYAEHAVLSRRSIAYSDFHLGKIDKLHLYGAAGTSWINENKFMDGRFTAIEIDADSYVHNGNVFLQPKMEAGATLTVTRGSSNHFYWVRGEGGVTVTFGASAHHNVVTQHWHSNGNARGSTLTVASDAGYKNAVMSAEDSFSTSDEVLRLDRSLRIYNNTMELAVNHAPSVHALTTQVPIPGFDKLDLTYGARPVADTGLIPVRDTGADVVGDEHKSLVDRFSVVSDTDMWRPRAWVYDSNMQLLDGTSTTYLSGSLTWVAGSPGYYGVGSDAALIRVAVVHPDVAYVRIVLQVGTRMPFGWVKVLAHRYENSDDSAVQTARRQVRRPLYQTTSPVSGFAQVGQTVGKSGGVWTCTARNDTTLASGAASAATSVTVTAAGTMAVSDVIGILLDDRTTHWTTISSVSGTTIGLTAGLPSAAASGRLVAAMRWA